MIDRVRAQVKVAFIQIAEAMNPSMALSKIRSVSGKIFIFMRETKTLCFCVLYVCVCVRKETEEDKNTCSTGTVLRNHQKFDCFRAYTYFSIYKIVTD